MRKSLINRSLGLMLLPVFGSMAFAGSAMAITTHYTFSGVPATGWVISTDKSLSANSSFRTTLTDVYGTPQIEAEKGILFRGVNKVTGQYWDLRTGVTTLQKVIIPAAAVNRTIYVKLQTIGATKGATTAIGYWYYN